MENNTERRYLECERWWVFALLTVVGGFLGAFTYSIRGGVFSNAQTGNLVLMSMAFANGKFGKALYYLLPIGAYFAGIVVSELIPMKLRKIGLIRWETVLAGVEVTVLLLLGFLPESAPYQISQIAINVICAMQFNTFRQAQGIPMATTFCTNNLRQASLNLLYAAREKDRAHLLRGLFYVTMLNLFVVGGVLGALLCKPLLGRSIWIASGLMCIVFIDLLYADLTKERAYLSRVPNGHEGGKA